ncbi:hypothetical protein AVDCRST_MAG92-632 [uncultured Coleofasciculus sp.]|uniref:Uncharacterized protein n=1 Tax=uncultured Coleofasciculus sp. TaxID=1267456 RepID=A0A6J4HHV1_9CYAN|nr:hypothetical protein AVDCRST_MAG92-632 [uncultured Coleofasciculus sp.]
MLSFEQSCSLLLPSQTKLGSYIVLSLPSPSLLTFNGNFFSINFLGK